MDNKNQKQEKIHIEISQDKNESVSNASECIDEENQKLKEEIKVLKFMIVIILIIIFNVIVFKDIENWAIALGVVVLELLGILVYSKDKKDAVIIDIWKEILDIFKKKIIHV